MDLPPEPFSSWSRARLFDECVVFAAPGKTTEYDEG